MHGSESSHWGDLASSSYYRSISRAYWYRGEIERSSLWRGCVLQSYLNSEAEEEKRKQKPVKQIKVNPTPSKTVAQEFQFGLAAHI